MTRHEGDYYPTPPCAVEGLRLGRWQDVLADIEVDAVICDPPYSGRTHAGALVREGWTQIDYSRWTPDDVADFVASWSPRARGWMACMTSHDLIPAYEEAYRAAGRLPFAPVSCVISAMGVRQQGDGPASWTVYLMVARPRGKSAAKWRALPGAYVVKRAIGQGGGRGKPLDLMRAIVRDYSRPGDLVCDPCAGWGHTLIAARAEGRAVLGAEVDPAAHAEAVARLSVGPGRDLFTGGAQ